MIHLIIDLLLPLVLGIGGTIVVVPLIQEPVERRLVSLFARSRLRGKTSLSGEWSQRWWEDGQTDFERWETHGVFIRQFGNSVLAEFLVGYDQYRVLARIESARFLTGTWSHQYEGGTYHGAFQLRIFPSGDLMHGRWVGFSRSNTIKTGTWQWKRGPRRDYAADESLPVRTDPSLVQ